MLLLFSPLFSSAETEPLAAAAAGHLANSSSPNPINADQHPLASNLTQAAAMALNQQHDPYTLPCFKDLYAVLFECFSIITLGYLSCRFKLISPDAKDLGSYLTTFALPMIIFLNIAQMEFQTINLSFLFCMLIAKLSLFILVTLLTLATSYPTNFSYAGALSILATQSNDFALGYPLIKSLYGETKPEMLNYLSLMAPIQLLILNPLGIIMLEYEKTRRRKRTNGSWTARRNSVLGRGSCNKCSSRPTHGDESAGYNGAASLHHGSRCDDIDNNNNNNNNNDRRHQSYNHDHSRLHHFKPVSSNQNPTQARLTGALCQDTNGAVISASELNGDNLLDDVFMTKDFGHGQDAGVYGQTASPVAKLALLKQPDVHLNKTRLSLVMPARAIDLDCASSTSIESLDCDDMVESSRTAEMNTKFNNSSPKSDLSRVVFDLPAGETAPNRYRDPSRSGQQELTTSNSGRSLGGRRHSACSCRSLNQEKRSLISWSFLKALVTNPLIIASVVALMVNLINGPQLPKLLTKVSNTIAASFAAPALFVVGLSMYGKFELLVRSPNDLLLSSVLVITKVILLPSLMRTITMLILPAYVAAEDIPYLTDFSYLYGLLPTAPTACIIAKQYEVLTNVVSISMLLSTFISAPLMLATSAIISQSMVMDFSAIQGIILQTLRTSSVITFALSLVTLCFLCRTNRLLNYVNFTNLPEVTRQAAKRIKSNSTHLFSFLLVLSQLLIGIGGSVWLFVEPQDLSLLYSGQPLSAAASRFQVVNSDDTLPNGSSLDSSMLAHEATLNVTTLDELMDNESESVAGEDVEVHEILISTPKSHTPEFKMLCAAQYMFSTSGLLMARLVIASMVLITVAQLLRGNRMAARLSSWLMKLFLIVGTGTIILAIFEFKHLKCMPTESSLPTWRPSLYLRLAFNGILLLVSIPLLSVMFRSGNKASWLRQISADQEEHPATAKLNRRQFLVSSASLSSDTSSAITSNTNLDSLSSPIVNLASQMIDEKPDRSRGADCDHIASKLPAGSSPPPPPTVIDCNELESMAQQRQLDQNHNYGQAPGRTPTTHRQQTDRSSSSPTGPMRNLNENCHTNSSGRINNRDTDIGAALRDDISPSSATHQATSTSNSDSLQFNRYSVLIVFMIIQVVLNVTTIIQILAQDKPYGTFRQIEIANVALDFGQGLLKFLVLGSSWFPRKLISFTTSCKSILSNLNGPSTLRRNC